MSHGQKYESRRGHCFVPPSQQITPKRPKCYNLCISTRYLSSVAEALLVKTSNAQPMMLRKDGALELLLKDAKLELKANRRCMNSPSLASKDHWLGRFGCNQCPYLVEGLFKEAVSCTFFFKKTLPPKLLDAGSGAASRANAPVHHNITSGRQKKPAREIPEA